jgi:ClpP class serine protease
MVHFAFLLVVVMYRQLRQQSFVSLGEGEVFDPSQGKSLWCVDD